MSTSTAESATMPTFQDGADSSELPPPRGRWTPEEWERFNRVFLHPDDELAGPEWYPRLTSLGAGFMFRSVVRANEPARPEYITIPMGRLPSDRTAIAVAEWNAMWEAAQYRRRVFPTYSDEVPPEMLKITEKGDLNVIYVPRTRTRYFEYAPLFHLLPRRTVERFGLPLCPSGQWPFMADYWDPDRHLPDDFATRLSQAWAATVWRHLSPGSRLIGFTKNDPIRLVAHSLDFWLPAVTEVMEAEMRTWPEVTRGDDVELPAQLHLTDGSVLRDATAALPRLGGDVWTGEDAAAGFVLETVEAADRTGRLRAVLDAVRSHRVEDDFSSHWTYAREDFERKLYRKRDKIKVRFVELPDTIPVQGPETEVIDRIVFGDFMALLDQQERQVVVLMQSGTTKLTDIAEIMGYRNHSPVSKRLKNIRETAARFFEEA